MIRKQRPVRISKACEQCRKQKVKCSGPPLCKNCEKYGDPCVFRSRYRESTKSRMDKQALGIPDHVSISVQSQGSEFFGSASNFAFVNQLNHYLRQLDEGTQQPSVKHENNNGPGLERFGLKPTVLEHSTTNISLDEFTTAQVNAMLVAYLETWSIPIPLFEAEQVFRLAADVWKNPHASAEYKAMLYLIMSIGAATSYFDLEESSATAFPVSKSFFDLARSTVPNILSELSFSGVKVVFLMSVAACNLGDTALSYLYTGIAVRISLAIGLHRDNGARSSTSTMEARHRRRVWATVWQFEQYWSFCVGRPSSVSTYIGVPNISAEDFVYQGLTDNLDTPKEKDGLSVQGRFSTTAPHSMLRLRFGHLVSKVHAELYSTRSDLRDVLSKVEHLSTEIDQLYYDSPDKLIVRSVVDDSVSDVPLERIREWFWIRIYYLYIKLMIYRPILIFSAYIDAFREKGNGNTNTPPDFAATPLSIKSKVKSGSDDCVRTAIELSNFVIRLNKKFRMVQPIVFLSTYLESTSTVLLFYILSSLADIPDPLAREIWQVLQDTRNFLNGSYGSYLESTQMLARDGLESLQKLLKSRNNHENNTYLDRLIKPVTTGSPYHQLSLDGKTDGGLESMWLQTLDWLDYA